MKSQTSLPHQGRNLKQFPSRLEFYAVPQLLRHIRELMYPRLIIISSMPHVERCCLHEVPPVSTILCSPPRGVKTKTYRPMLVGFRSFSTVRVHVCLGRPRGRFQAAGGPRIAARRARRWSISGSDLAMWLKSCSRLRRTMSVATSRSASSTISYFTVAYYDGYRLH